MTHDLTDRQQRMLDFIESFYKREKKSPTIREIGEACEISSTSVVSYNLDRLEYRGYIERDRDSSRGIILFGVCPCCGTKLEPS